MNRKPWTPEEDQYMRDHYPDELGNDIARALGRTIASMYGRAYLLGLSKSEAFNLSDFSGRLNGKQGRNSRFPKGHVPDNKGKKMSAEVYEKAKPTMFKKGNCPQNHQPVGSIGTRSDHKRGNHHLYIKTAEPNKWEQLHRHNYEAEHGPIPKGMNLVFKDNNYQNCEPDNLELITKGENMKRNTIHARYPEELKKAILMLGATKRKIREHEEQN